MNVRMVDVGHEDGDALRGDPPRETLAEGDPHALLDLLLDAAGGASDQLIGRCVVEEDRHRVDAQGLADAHEEFLEQGVEAELGERRVTQAVEIADLLGGCGHRAGRTQHDLTVTGLGRRHVDLRGSGRHRSLESSVSIGKSKPGLTPG